MNITPSSPFIKVHEYYTKYITASSPLIKEHEYYSKYSPIIKVYMNITPSIVPQ